jgi:acetyltransferase-like isoleucine patch superfamily enzyme
MQQWKENAFRGALNRFLQTVARTAPGAETFRVRLHRWRGVNIGQNVWIGYDAIIETSKPYLVTLEDRAVIGIRTIIIAHMRENHGVVIRHDAMIGPGAMILPNVVIGAGAVVTAGSVVTTSVAPMTVVQGNPAKPIARCGIVFGRKISVREFTRNLRPLH